jgi:hypothetical protein
VYAPCSQLLDAWDETLPEGRHGYLRPVVVIDEADKLMSWREEYPKQLADLLSFFVALTKQRNRCHVLMVTSECGYLAQLSKGGEGPHIVAFCAARDPPTHATADCPAPLLLPPSRHPPATYRPLASLLSVAPAAAHQPRCSPVAPGVAHLPLLNTALQAPAAWHVSCCSQQPWLRPIMPRCSGHVLRLSHRCCPSASALTIITRPLPSRIAEVGTGFWKAYAFGDFAEGDARRYFAEELMRAGSRATLDDDVWAKVYEVRHCARSAAELLVVLVLVAVSRLFVSAFVTAELCCNRFVVATLEPLAAWRRRW